MARKISIADIREIYLRGNPDGRFFTPGTMGFRQSKLPRSGVAGAGGVFFVSEDRFDPWTPELFSVRRVSEGEIETPCGFQAFKSGREAQACAKNLADGKKCRCPNLKEKR